MNSPSRLVQPDTYLWPLSLCLALVIVQLLPDTIWQLLPLDRPALESGQWWRIFSAHFAHLSWLHLLYNGLLLVLWQQFYGQLFSAWQWMALVAVLSAGVSTGILLNTPDVDWYVGFSGVLVGLFIAGALLTIRREPWISGAVCAVITIKIVLEQWPGEAIVTSTFSDIPTVVDAHLYGAITAVFYWSAITLINRGGVRPLSG